MRLRQGMNLGPLEQKLLLSDISLMPTITGKNQIGKKSQRPFILLTSDQTCYFDVTLFQSLVQNTSHCPALCSPQFICPTDGGTDRVTVREKARKFIAAKRPLTDSVASQTPFGSGSTSSPCGTHLLQVGQILFIEVEKLFLALCGVKGSRSMAACSIPQYSSQNYLYHTCISAFF